MSSSYELSYAGTEVGPLWPPSSASSGSSATAAGWIPARHDDGSAAQPTQRTSGRRAITTSPPANITSPSISTAPPEPNASASPAVISAPSGSTPTNAAAQIAIARARIASDDEDWITTVESPMNTTPLKPPTTASTSVSPSTCDAPTPATATAVHTNASVIGSPLFARRESRSSTTAPSSEPSPIAAVSAPSVPAPPCSTKRAIPGSMNATGGVPNNPANSVSTISDASERWPNT